MSQQQPNVTSEVLDTTAAPAVQVVALFHEEVREVAELRTPRAGQRAEFVVGEAPGASFHMALASEACAGLTSLPLVRSTAAGFVLTFLPAWQGEVTLGGVTAPLATVAQGRATASATVPGALELAIPASARISVDVGDVTFIVTSGAPARRYAAPMVVDRGFLGYLAGAAAFAALALGLMNAVPPDASAMSMDKVGRPNVVAELQMKAKDAVDQPEVAIDDSVGEAGSKGGAAKGPGGKLGDKNATADKAKMAIPDRGIAPTFANQVANANQRGREVGIVGALNRMGGDRWALITSKSPFASDIGDRSYDGGWDGEFGNQRGTDWGGGPDGDLWGGNGTKDGTVGNGDYDTIRKGPGDNNDPWTAGDGKPDPVRPKKRYKPITDLSGATAEGGGLDKAIIQREIRKHRASFEACYERELMVDETLSGTVDTKFVIMSNGQVRAVRANGVSPKVASCIGAVISRVAFPSTGGGTANVTYPFSFRKAGE